MGHKDVKGYTKICEISASCGVVFSVSICGSRIHDTSFLVYYHDLTFEKYSEIHDYSYSERMWNVTDIYNLYLSFVNLIKSLSSRIVVQYLCLQLKSVSRCN